MTPEAKVRNPVIKWAKAHGIGHIRMSFRPGVASGWPDDLFLLPGAVAVFVEFKRAGKEPTLLQAEKLRKCHELGFHAEWFDNADAACSYLASILVSAPVHDQGGGFPKDPLRRWIAAKAGRP